MRHGEPVVGEHCAAGDPRDRAARGKLVAQAVDVPVFVGEHHAEGLRLVGRDVSLLSFFCALELQICGLELQRRDRDENVLRSRSPVAESQRVVGFLGVQGDEWGADHAVEHRFPAALFAHVDLFVVVDERKRQECPFPLGHVLCIVEIKLPVPSDTIVCQSEKGVVDDRRDVGVVDNAPAVASQLCHALQLFQIVLRCVKFRRGKDNEVLVRVVFLLLFQRRIEVVAHAIAVAERMAEHIVHHLLGKRLLAVQIDWRRTPIVGFRHEQGVEPHADHHDGEEGVEDKVRLFFHASPPFLLWCGSVFLFCSMCPTHVRHSATSSAVAS